jgi:signal transduction histidine kinase
MSLLKSPFAGEKILVVDDEDVIVELTTLLLQKRGFEVFNASNGRACLEMVEKHQPALVLLDYMMPVMNGIEALTLIRRRFPNIHVMMFTGKGSEEVAVQAMKAGAVDYVRKPFVNQSLLAQIDAVLTRRQIEEENRKLTAERELLQREIKEWNRELEKRVRQKSQELERAHQEIIQAEKLAAVGHVTAGMAHEIRNPLNSINLFAQILSADESIGAENREYVEKIVHEVERIDNILVQMLASSKAEESSNGKVDLLDVLRSVIESSKTMIEAQGVALDLDLASSVPCLKADPLEMEQIFTNLIGNALYEMPDGGALRIVLDSDAEKIKIAVCDDGPGIPSENLQRVFDPFFTTRKKGTGFGLSVVLRIVKGCGGRIRVDSSPGKGACFSIELPLLPDSVH